MAHTKMGTRIVRFLFMFCACCIHLGSSAQIPNFDLSSFHNYTGDENTVFFSSTDRAVTWSTTDHVVRIGTNFITVGLNFTNPCELLASFIEDIAAKSDDQLWAQKFRLLKTMNQRSCDARYKEEVQDRFEANCDYVRSKHVDIFHGKGKMSNEFS